MKSLHVVVVGSFAVFSLAGCVKQVPGQGGPGPFIYPRAALIVRSAFDSDASSIIGSFIPDSVADDEVNESQSMRTRCSKYIKPKKVAAGGEYEDVFAASSGFGGKIGMQNIAQVKGERSTTMALRIKYNASETLKGEVDEVGLDQCCRAAPNQCPGRYISEVIAGDGRIFSATSRDDSVGVEAQGTFKTIPISGDAFYRDGLKWERQIDFKNQYFAFATKRVVAPVVDPQLEGCRWVNQLPQSLDGKYYVGISSAAIDESAAFENAKLKARQEIIRDLGESISQSSSSSTALNAAATSDTVVKTTSEGISRLVEFPRRCGPEVREGLNGNQYTMKVLAYLPNEQRKAALRIQVTSLIEKLRKDGTLTAPLEKELKDSIDNP